MVGCETRPLWSMSAVEHFTKDVVYASGYTMPSAQCLRLARGKGRRASGTLALAQLGLVEKPMFWVADRLRGGSALCHTISLRYSFFVDFLF